MECLLCRWTQEFSSRYTVSLTFVERGSCLWLASFLCVWLVACRLMSAASLVEIVPTFVRVVRKNRSLRYRTRASVYVVVFTEKFGVCAMHAAGSHVPVPSACRAVSVSVPVRVPCRVWLCVPCRYVPCNAVLLRVVP